MMMILPENVSTTTDCVKTLPLFLKWIIHIKIFVIMKPMVSPLSKWGKIHQNYTHLTTLLYVSSSISFWYGEREERERERERRWLKEEELSKSTQPDVRPIIINLSWIATKGSEQVRATKIKYLYLTYFIVSSLSIELETDELKGWEPRDSQKQFIF